MKATNILSALLAPSVLALALARAFPRRNRAGAGAGRPGLRAGGHRRRGVPCRRAVLPLRRLRPLRPPVVQRDRYGRPVYYRYMPVAYGWLPPRR